MMLALIFGPHICCSSCGETLQSLVSLHRPRCVFGHLERCQQPWKNLGNVFPDISCFLQGATGRRRATSKGHKRGCTPWWRRPSHAVTLCHLVASGCFWSVLICSPLLIRGYPLGRFKIIVLGGCKLPHALHFCIKDFGPQRYYGTSWNIYSFNNTNKQLNTTLPLHATT